MLSAGELRTLWRLLVVRHSRILLSRIRREIPLCRSSVCDTHRRTA